MAPLTNVLVSTFHPFPTLCFQLPPTTPLSSLPHILSPLCPPSLQNLSLSSGRVLPVSPSATISDVTNSEDGDARFRLAVRVKGGKGGFGSQLRAAGGRMSSQKTSNNDSCRTLDGRRLSTIKEAKKLAAYLESEPARQAAARDTAKAKLESLNKEIERLNRQVDDKGEGPSAAGRKRRFEDNEYVEQSREIVENVKSAVKDAFLKKRKKAKTSPSPPIESTTQPSATQTTSESSSLSAPATNAESVAGASTTTMADKGKGKGKAVNETSAMVAAAA